jgi:hypothetical protein
MEAFMKNTIADIKPASLISFIIVLPFIILEMVNGQDLDLGFPTALFFMLWLLPVIFIVTLLPIIRTIQNREPLLAHPILLFLRVAFLVFIAVMWMNIMIDQMPCFMGVPNCD